MPSREPRRLLAFRPIQHCAPFVLALVLVFVHRFEDGV